MVVAGITCVVSPLSLLTSFYGMNVEEFTSDSKISLFNFWKGGLPVVLATVIPFTLLIVWLTTGGTTQLLASPRRI